MSAVTVRRAVDADQVVLARLLSDMQARYRSPDPPGGASEMATDATNEGAQQLYDRLGVPRHDKIFYRLSGDNLRQLAAG